MISNSRHKVAYVIGAATLLALAAVALTLLPPTRDTIAKADALRERGDLLGALDLYQEVLAEDPNNERALWGVAAAHLARQDRRMGLEYLNRYLNRHPRGRYATEAQQTLQRVRGDYVAAEQPSPELVPSPPTRPSQLPTELQAVWERAEKLERRQRWLDAITVYAAVAESSADGATRAAAFERMALCEARRPPFDYNRVRHFYARAQRVYREIGDFANAQRCQQLAQLAGEYAKIKAERERLVREQQETVRQTRAAAPQRGPRELFQETLSAYRAGNYALALQSARGLVTQVPAAWYVIGMIHTREGDWEAARQELQHYLSLEPNTEFAEQARRELISIQGKRPVFLDTFLRPATRWRIRGEKPDVIPITEVLAGPEPSDGPCLRVDPGQAVYTSFGVVCPATIGFQLYVPRSDAPPLPRVRWQLYGPDALTCAPLYLTDKGYQFQGQRGKPIPSRSGWQTLSIDVTTGTVTAHVDARFIGETSREASFGGVLIVAGEGDPASPLYIDEVRVVQPLYLAQEPRSSP